MQSVHLVGEGLGGLKVKNVGEGDSENSGNMKPPSGGVPLRVELTDLIQLGRTAYDQKRRKDSLALTNAILKIDPASNEARLLQSLIKSDINLAVQRLNAMVKNPLMKNDEELRTNAFQMLQSVLDIDPTNKAATDLIPEIDPSAKRDPPANPQAPASKNRTEAEKRANPPEWNPPAEEPSEVVETAVAKPRNRNVQYAVLIGMAVIVAVLIAAHFGIFTMVLERFGFSGQRKAPETTRMETIRNQPPGPYFDMSGSLNPDAVLIDWREKSLDFRRQNAYPQL